MSPRVEALVDDRENFSLAQFSIGAMGAAVERILEERKELLAAITEPRELFGKHIGHLARRFRVGRQHDADEHVRIVRVRVFIGHIVITCPHPSPLPEGEGTDVAPSPALRERAGVRDFILSPSSNLLLNTAS